MGSRSRKSRRRKRLWWSAGIACAILIGLGCGEWAASSAISRRLSSLVANKLDARLAIGRLVYIPPFGACAWNARLVRDGQDLMHADRVMLSLTRPPWSGDPIIISSLTMSHPVLDLAPGALKGLVKPGARAMPPVKLSDMLQLEHVRIDNGTIEYGDRREADSPGIWDGLSLDMKLSRQSPAAYQFSLNSQAGSTADSNAAGTLDVDALTVDIQSLTLSARADPSASVSALPAPVQAIVRKYQLNGLVSLAGSGNVRLRQPSSAAFTAEMSLEDASAVLPARGRNFPLNNVQARLSIHKRGGGAIAMLIKGISAASGDDTATIGQGEVSIDPAGGTWSAKQIQGRADFVPPDATPPTPIAYRGPAPVLPPPPGTNGFDRLALGGGLEFTAAASGPLQLQGHDPWQAIHHEIILYPRDASFQPKNFYHRIEHINGEEVRIVNGVIIFQELSGQYQGDALRLRGARLTIKGLPKVQHWQEISGIVNFYPPLAQYTPGLDRILQTLHPSGPFIVSGWWTNDRTGEYVKRDYELMISSDSGAFTVSPRHIALANIRGDATAVPAGIDMHSVKADVLGGEIEVSGHWLNPPADKPQLPARYQADVTLRSADLSRIERRLGDTSDQPLSGLVYADGAIGGAAGHDWSTSQKLASLRGDGQVEILDGDLYQIPGLSQIAGAIGLKGAATMSDAAGIFDVKDGRLSLSHVAINSPIIGLQGSGTILLPDHAALDLNVVAAPLADWRDKLQAMNIPIVSGVVADIAGGIQKLLNSATGTLLYAFHVHGPASQAKVDTVPVPVLSDAAAMIFGRMLASPPAEQPQMLDVLRQGTASPAGEKSARAASDPPRQRITSH